MKIEGRHAARAAGVPAAPAVVYNEDFENTTGDPVKLTNYISASGETYTADPAWLTNCNGWVLDSADSAGYAPGIADCDNSDPAWEVVRSLAQALGIDNGSTDPTKNHAVAAQTQGDPGANLVEFETVRPIPLSAQNHYISFSVRSSAMNCASVGPSLKFFLLNSSTAIPASATGINPCTDPTAKDYTVDNTAIKVVRAASDAPVLYSGSSLGIRMINEQGSGAGNDAAFDDIQILDVTPTATKAFSPAAAPVGGTSTLTITVTNTSDLLEKDGWSFTDDLPAGLSVASTPNTSTTCTNGKVTATAGSSSVGLSGDLTKGQVSCTLSVDVTSSTAGTYHNCPDSGSALVGMNWTECADVEFATPQYTITKTADPASGSTVHPGDTVSYSVTVENTGTVPVNATATDDLTAVLDDATYDTNASATTGTVTYTAPKLSWSGTLAAGALATITYSVTVKDPDPGDEKLDNQVTGNSYSNCLTGGEPGCATHENVSGLQISKSADVSSAKPGEKVAYTVTVSNPGKADYTGASFTDDLTAVLDDAAYGNDATTSSGTASYTAPTLSWSGDVPAGQTVTVTYSVTVNNPDTGDHELSNTVVGPAASNCPDGSTDPVCSTRTDVTPLPTPTPTLTPTPPLPDTGTNDFVQYTAVASALTLALGTVITAAVRSRSRRY